jgi:hypothetical protein
MSPSACRCLRLLRLVAAHAQLVAAGCGRRGSSPQHNGAMDRTTVEQWVAHYERLWRTPGTQLLAELFAADASYRPSPWARPVEGWRRSRGSGRPSVSGRTRSSRCPATSWQWTPRPRSSGCSSRTARLGAGPGMTCGCSGLTRTVGAPGLRSGHSHQASPMGTRYFLRGRHQAPGPGQVEPSRSVSARSAVAGPRRLTGEARAVTQRSACTCPRPERTSTAGRCTHA